MKLIKKWSHICDHTTSPVNVSLSICFRKRPLTPCPRHQQQHFARVASGRVRSCQNWARAKFREFKVAGVHNEVSISNALFFIFWPKKRPNPLPLVAESNIIAGGVWGGIIFGHIQPGPDSENFRWRGGGT